jgi:VWFA-related protein
MRLTFFRALALPLSLVLALPQVNGQDVTFTSDVHLVVVDISVKDKSGKVIPDLKKTDFTVVEDGKPQAISVFEFQKLDSDEPLPAVPAAKEAKPPETKSAATAAPAAAQPKTTSSSLLASTPKPIIRFQDRRLVAMLFDFSTMPVADQARAQKAAIDFLQHQM